MSKHRSIWWLEDEARLKNYSATAKSSGASVIKLEIEVLDSCAFGMIVRSLEDIKREQDEASRKGRASSPARPRGRPAVEARRSTPLLTYRGDDD
ncbi:hypothetical protein V5G24_00125 [Xanthobacter sp. VTT E-85241]|uniref:hypothetical protein n=1 Tax=Roseixanthobacter finlandensis TaxID=3119922 RepID=UPI00372B8F75